MVKTMNRNIRLIYIHTVCTQILFLLAVLVPYYQTIGLSFRQFLIGEAAFSAVVLLAEVPSGWISDVWTRRATLILGAFFGIVGYCGILLAENFWQATLAQAIIGIAVALNSGTNTALLYDTLLEQGRESEYRRLDGQRHALGIYGVAFSVIAGSFCFTIHPKLPAIMDVIVICIGMIVIAFVREPARHTKSVERHIFHDMWETMKYALSGHPEITGIIMVSTVIMCSTKLMMWTQQPYYEGLGVPVAWFGAMMGSSYIVGGICGHFSHRFEHLGSNRAALGTMVLALLVACLALSALHVVWPAVPLFLTGTLCYAMGVPRINNAINSRVGSERRATILSTANLMVHCLFVPTSLVLGKVVDAGDVRDGLVYVAGLLCVLGGCGLRLWGRQAEKEAIA